MAERVVKVLRENDIYAIAYQEMLKFVRNADLPAYKDVDRYSFFLGAFQVAEAIAREIKGETAHENNEDKSAG